MSDSSPHSIVEDFARVRSALGAANSSLNEQRGRAALERIEEQYQAARELLVETHDLIWNEDAAVVAGGEQWLDALAEKIMAYLNSNPASEPKAQAYRRQAEAATRAIESSPGWLRDTAVPPSSPAKRPTDE